MTHPMEMLSISQPESGQGLHTQESGDAGLSSDITYMCSDTYNASDLPLADRGDSMKPIPKGEQDIPAKLGMERKIWSYPVPSEERFSKPSALTEQKNATPTAHIGNSPQQETVSPGTAITDGQQDHVVGEDGGLLDSTMETEGKPAKPKGEPKEPLEGRNNNLCGKRAVGRNWTRLSMAMVGLLVLAPVSGGLPGAQPAADKNLTCFACEDVDKCRNIHNIIDTGGDTFRYSSNLNQSFPPCLGLSNPSPGKCVVCNDQSNITIKCLGVVESFNVETTDGETISSLNISSVECATTATSRGLAFWPQTPGRAYYGWIPAGIFVIVVVPVLVIFSIYTRRQQSRVENGQVLGRQQGQDEDTVV